MEYATQERIYDAVEDIRAAMRFVRKNAELYRIDPDMVVAAGESAGAITTLHMSYAQKF